jgi:hypothetical protein
MVCGLSKHSRTQVEADSATFQYVENVGKNPCVVEATTSDVEAIISDVKAITSDVEDVLLGPEKLSYQHLSMYTSNLSMFQLKEAT